MPLVIAGSVGRETSSAPRLAALVASLTPRRPLRRRRVRPRRRADRRPGSNRSSARSASAAFTMRQNYRLLTELNCALHAQVLLRRDVDYIVRDGRIGVVDEFTGRVVADRHWPDGLQAALEAKEGVERQPDGRILGSITLQHFLRGYPAPVRHDRHGADRRGGAARAVRPRRGRRADAPPDDPRRSTRTSSSPIARPRSGRWSTRSSGPMRPDGRCSSGRSPSKSPNASRRGFATARRRLRRSSTRRTTRWRRDRRRRRGAGRRHDLHEHGRPRAPTSGWAARTRPTHDQVAALGGLYVIGTNRHESRRVDLQLRGRAGRQGDPGESRFFVSLEDDLLVRYGIEALIARSRRDRPSGDEPHRPSGAAPRDRPRAAHHRRAELRDPEDAVAVRVGHRGAAAPGHGRRGRRSCIGERCPEVWAARPSAQRALVDEAGEDAVRDAERTVMLFQIDRAWRDHLALAADLREGIHLVSLGGQDPLTRFTTEMTSRVSHAWRRDRRGRARRAGRRSRERRSDRSGGSRDQGTVIDLDLPGQRRSVRNQIGMMLTGPGRTTIAIYAAAMMVRCCSCGGSSIASGDARQS